MIGENSKVHPPPLAHYVEYTLDLVRDRHGEYVYDSLCRNYLMVMMEKKVRSISLSVSLSRVSLSISVFLSLGPIISRLSVPSLSISLHNSLCLRLTHPLVQFPGSVQKLQREDLHFCWFLFDVIIKTMSLRLADEGLIADRPRSHTHGHPPGPPPQTGAGSGALSGGTGKGAAFSRSTSAPNSPPVPGEKQAVEAPSPHDRTTWFPMSFVLVLKKVCKIGRAHV